MSSSATPIAMPPLPVESRAEMKQALGIGGVSTSSSYWKVETDKKKEVEVDLVIDRADQCINLCEIKFCNEEFSLSKSYSEELNRKKSLFKKFTETNKGIFITLITPFGAKENGHFQNVIDQQLSLEALFNVV